jgi:hypothetical protein
MIFITASLFMLLYYYVSAFLSSLHLTGEVYKAQQRGNDDLATKYGSIRRQGATVVDHLPACLCVLLIVVGEYCGCLRILAGGVAAGELFVRGEGTIAVLLIKH